MFTVDESRDDELSTELQRAVRAYNRANSTTWAVDVDGQGACRVRDTATDVLRALDYRAERPLLETTRRAAGLWNRYVAGR